MLEEKYYFSVWLRNQLQSDGLEPVLSHKEKSCITSNYRQFSTNIRIRLIPVLIARAFEPSGLTNLVLLF